LLLEAKLRGVYAARSSSAAGDRGASKVAEVRFEQATKIYPGTDVPAVESLDLHIEDGEFMVLVGPSGSGKTTALRMLAGLEDVDAGGIYIGDRDVTYVQPKHRDISMVFQNYALYPYLTVAQNIGFPLKIAKVRKSVREARVREVATKLGLERLLDRRPGQLSGGERQRVAMGRAIVRVPSVFLMDEPLSNLDAKLRVQMRADVAALQAEFGVTTVYVTHDQAEAMTLGHRVAVLRGGQLQQCGAPRELYDRPVNTFVAGFIGSPAMNLCPVQLGANGSIALGEAKIAVDDALARAARSNGRADLVLGLRPESLEVGPAGVPAKVEVVEELGADAYVFCVAEVGGQELKLVARTKARDVPQRGERVSLSPRPNEAHLFDSATGERLDAT
jgi:multiple sugar transport system ATP-binding protein